MTTNCEDCMNGAFDEEYEEYYCTLSLDEDEYARFLERANASCPYFRAGDDYSIVRKQN